MLPQFPGIGLMPSMDRANDQRHCRLPCSEAVNRPEIFGKNAGRARESASGCFKRVGGGEWCGGGDLNPYALWALAPQASASANFATSA
jgi:hypothetical protein